MPQYLLFACESVHAERSSHVFLILGIAGHHVLEGRLTEVQMILQVLVISTHSQVSVLTDDTVCWDQL